MFQWSKVSEMVLCHSLQGSDLIEKVKLTKNPSCKQLSLVAVLDGDNGF